MPFSQQLPEWNKGAAKPAQTKLNEGWLPEEKPAASTFNWQFNWTYLALKELQENSIHKEKIGVDIETPTAAQTKATAAQAAAIDWAKSFGLGDVAKDISSTDLNNLDGTGFYKGSSLTNAPTTVANNVWTILHEKVSSTGASQLAMRVAATNEIYIRNKSGGTWSAWTQLETTTGAQTKATAAQTAAIDWAKGFGLGPVAKSLGTVDLNAISEVGFYHVGRESTNLPYATTAAFVVSLDNGVVRTQFAFVNGTSSFVFVRYYNGTWSAWVQLETTAGAQSKVDTHANKKDNPHAVTKEQVGLGSTPNYGVATQAEAEAGTADNKLMTPLQTKRAILKHAPTPSTSTLTLTDSGNYYTADNVESALQEVGQAMTALRGSMITNVNSILGM